MNVNQQWVNRWYIGRPFLRTCIAALLLWQIAIGTAPLRAAEPSLEGIEFFEKRIRPLLAAHCYECHSRASQKSKGGLALDTRDAILEGGNSGTALVPGDPDQSLLITAVRQTDKELQMPPKQKLSDAQIADLEAWVKMGAPDPRMAEPLQVAALTPRRSGMSLEEGRQFWSFKAVQDPAVPAVKDAAWPRTPIDNFILARLEEAGVTPALAADRRTLLRRVTFDLTGLPPTPAEMEAFLADASPAAFEQVVDRLLASPRYGQRWGRHWLDVVRYADTCGNASDYPVPQAHKYRDWVIRAFNRDLPYDQFLREQIAGDLLPSDSDAERYDRITATGYLAISRRFGGDRTGEHHLTLEDTIDNLGRAVLGATISCARCHDHKFDAISQRDYYALFGTLASARQTQAVIDDDEVRRAGRSELADLKERIVAALAAVWRDDLAAMGQSLAPDRIPSSGAPAVPALGRALEDAVKAIDHPLHAVAVARRAGLAGQEPGLVNLTGWPVSRVMK